MKVHFAIIVLVAITWLPHVIPQKYAGYITYPNNQTKSARQSSADQMVQNILQWLQGSSADNIRKVRQDGLRAYLPPITHTQKPRPFEPAPPEDNDIIGFPPTQPSAPPGISPPYVAGNNEQPEEPYPQPQRPSYAGIDLPEPEQQPGVNEISHPHGETPVFPGPEEPSREEARPFGPEEPGHIHSTTFPSELPIAPDHYTQSPGITAVTDESGYPETPRPSFPSLGPPTGPQEPPESTGYPPAGQTPQPQFPSIGPPGGSQVPPESTGYAPAGHTSEPQFPSVGSDHYTESPGITAVTDESGYPETPRPSFPSFGPPTGPQVPPESTGYPPAGETPQPPFTFPYAPSSTIIPQEPIHPETTQPPPEIPGIEQTPGPVYPTELPSSPREPHPPESTGYPPAGETPKTPFPPSETPLPDGSFPGLSTSPPYVPPEVTGYPPAGDTPQSPFEPQTTPGQEGPTTTSTFPSFVRETTSPELPSKPETETPSPIVSSSLPEETFPPENPPQPTLPNVNSSPPPLEITEKEEPSYPPLPEVNPSTQPPEPSKPITEPEIGETDEEQKIIPPTPDEEDLNHPPHIHELEVECAKDMMTINIEFNRQFDGVIYSKGFYNDPECRYVNENSGETKYSFTVKLNSCGTQFINAFDTANQSYLENILVLQNEAGIQEVWDTIRAVRCLWEGNLSKSLTVSLSIGMLSEEIVTFSGDTAVARLDIQRGEGPFAPSANGLVPIGEKMTLVISVTGDPGFDIQVKECKAKDADGKLEYTLTDENGCILRPKLFGSFQKTRSTGNSGASIIAYAFFNAFKFPDLMDLMLECNVELCKTDCDVCSDPNEKLQPGKRRRRDLYNETIGEPVKVGRYLRVLLPQDLSDGEVIVPVKQLEGKKICLSATNFVLTCVISSFLAVLFIICSIYVCLKRRPSYYKQQE